MTKPHFDIMKIFENVSPYPGPWKPREGKDHELSQVLDVIEGLKGYSYEVREYILCCQGLKIASEFKLPNIEVVAKNISWLTSVSFLKLDHLGFTTDSDDPTTYSELKTDIEIIRHRIAPFESLHLEGIVIPIPTTIEKYDGRFNTSDTIDLGKSVLNAGFSNQFLVQQMTEQMTMHTPCGMLELLLPRVARIPLSEILSIRKEYSSLFIRFQNELVKFIDRSDKSDSESKIVDLLGHIDNEIDIIRKEFETIDRKKRLEMMGLTFSFGVLSLVLLLPSEVYKSLAAILGSSSVFNTIRNIRLLEIERRELEDDPFYIPYRLTELERQVGNE